MIEFAIEFRGEQNMAKKKQVKLTVTGRSLETELLVFRCTSTIVIVELA